MKYKKIKLIDFVQRDRFELNSYLTYLFIQFGTSMRNEWKDNEQ